MYEEQSGTPSNETTSIILKVFGMTRSQTHELPHTRWIETPSTVGQLSLRCTWREKLWLWNSFQLHGLLFRWFSVWRSHLWVFGSTGKRLSLVTPTAQIPKHPLHTNMDYLDYVLMENLIWEYFRGHLTRWVHARGTGYARSSGTTDFIFG